MPEVAVNDFVRRQVKGSGKTYSPDLSFEEIAKRSEEQFERGYFREGYRDGVVLVEASSDMTEHFICPFVKINKNTKLTAEVIRRQKGEEPYVQIRALNGTPEKASKVEFVLYRHDVLAENDENTTDAEWELISIHAIPEGVKKLPMGPVTMMRNQLQLPGGTVALYSSEEWVESVRFWQRYAPLQGV